MLWYVEGLDHQSSLDKFLEQPLFDGKRFWDAEQEMEWVDDCIEEWMKDVVDFDILPMLSEYWFDDSSKLQRWENILHGVFQ